MRVLVVADVSAEHVHGGAERMLHHHIRALVQAEYQVTVLTRQPGPDSILCAPLEDLGVTEHRLPFSGDKGYQGLRQLRQSAKAWWSTYKGDFDVVVAEQPFVMWALLQAGCRLPRLQVCHSLAFEEYQTRHALNASVKHWLAMWMMKKIETKVYGSADKTLVLSRFMQARLNHFFGLEADKTIVVAGAAEQQRPVDENEREQLRRDLHWDKPVVVTLRNLVPRTGVDLMIQAAAIIKTKCRDVHWVIMGDGVLREFMQQMAAALEVDEVLEFTGFLSEEDVQKRLSAADVFMLPTRGLEGFGLVTLEANACGLPVLATPITANAELVPTIQHNQLADSASPAALAEKLLWMLENPVGAEQRQGIQAAVRQQYNWERHDQGFIKGVGSLT